MSEEIDREEYSNSKLTQVSFEMRFYPLLEIDTIISKFQKDIRMELPDLRIGQIVVQDTKGIQEKKQYSFRSKEGEITLNITNANLSIRHFQYSNFENFKKLIEGIVHKFTTIFESLEDLLFLGLRYINDFDFDNVDLNKIVEYFNSGLDSNRITEKQIDDFSIEQRFKINEGNFRLFIAFKTDPIINSKLFKIDMDSNYSDPNIQIETLGDKLEELHRNIKKEFLSIITEPLKEDVLRRSEE